MEAASRWETEAIRESRDRRRARPTVSQRSRAPDPAGDWRTLREASDETGIPLGTLRKWCRRETVDSYLESDGEQTLRMLEMGSVRRNAKATGRELVKSEQPTADSQQPEESYQPPATSHQPEPPAEAVLSTQYSVPSTADEVGTMIVPVDAWNKMLTQLGNLHEAGQQLAEARERAGKAETEVKFLRERLGEMRESHQPPAASRQPPATSYQLEGSGQETADSQQLEAGRQATGDRRQAEAEPNPDANIAPSSSSPSGGGAAAGGGGGQSDPIEDTTDSTQVPSADTVSSTQYSVPGTANEVGTVSFWRYVVRGWRGRKR